MTAIGGGTLRDVILDRPPLWLSDPGLLGVASVAAVAVFIGAHRLESRYRTLEWLDAFALAVAVPAGVGVALAEGQSWPIGLVMGMVTGCRGGLRRDVVCNEVPLVLKQGELYVSCAFAGAVAASGLTALGLPVAAALALCGLVTLTLRAGSLALGWRLPVYRPRPPRAPKR